MVAIGSVEIGACALRGKESLDGTIGAVEASRTASGFELDEGFARPAGFRAEVAFAREVVRLRVCEPAALKT